MEGIERFREAPCDLVGALFGVANNGAGEELEFDYAVAERGGADALVGVGIGGVRALGAEEREVAGVDGAGGEIKPCFVEIIVHKAFADLGLVLVDDRGVCKDGADAEFLGVVGVENGRGVVGIIHFLRLLRHARDGFGQL